MAMADPDKKVVPWHRTMWPLLPISAFRPLSSTISVEIAALCHPGKIKPYNEDNYLVIELGRHQRVIASSLPDAELPTPFSERAYAMMVADGIGGVGAGAVASRLALSTLAQLALHFGKWNLRVDPAIAEEIMDRLEWFYNRVQETVTSHSLTERGLSTMATAVTAAYSAGEDLFVAHIGHGRAYICREGHLTALTRDHTLAAKGYPGPGPADADHVTDDLRHILTNAIGGNFTGPSVDIEHFRLMHGDCLLLCTNGLTDLVDEYRIADVLICRRKLDEQCRMLIDLALQAGGADNITVVLAQYAMPQL
jgi:protein phosphatase